MKDLKRKDILKDLFEAIIKIEYWDIDLKLNVISEIKDLLKK